ncbi:agrin-like protein, partial [Dinothrombium tinctorium]
ECVCNKYGSYDIFCDQHTHHCHCKSGVGGPLCDRCEPGFWGLHMISEGNTGCIPCACNMLGSVRSDCEQMTGRCVCKQGVNGNKCDICPPGRILGLHGCADESIGQQFSKPCSELICLFGAKCKESNGKAQCVCDNICDEFVDDDSENGVALRDQRAVCGTDGNTYNSECHLKLYSCRIQESILIAHKSPCKT